MGRRALYALLAVSLVPLHVRLTEYAFDDAYIHVRIADHLVRYGEPYFNPGSAVMASSAPLWTIVLAGLFAAAGPSLFAIGLANALLTTLAVWIHAGLVRQASGAGPGALVDVLTALLVVPLVAASSVGLMETPLALSLAGAGMLLRDRRHPAGFLCLALAVFVRVELAVLFLGFAAAALIQRPRRLPAAILWSATGALPLLAYELYFFGTVVPSAVHAKAVSYDPTLSEALWRMVPLAADGLTAPLLVPGFLLAVTAGAFVVVGSTFSATARLSFVCGLAIAVAYVATDALVFEWYVPLYAVTLGWPMLAATLHPPAASLEMPVRRWAGIGALVLLLWPAHAGLAGYVRGAAVNPAYAPGFLQGARVQSYIAVGRDLFRDFPDQTLLTSEIGGLGHGFGGRLEDGFGLVSPEAVKYHPMPVPQARSSGILGVIPPGYVEELDPPLLVSYDLFIEAFLHSPAARRYVRVPLPAFRPRDLELARAARVPTDMWGIGKLNVFIRRDLYDGWRAPQEGP